MNDLLTLILLLLSLEIVYSQNNPLKDPNICGRPTCKGDGKFRYLKGIEHEYLYSIDINTLFNGTSKNESTLYVQTKALVDLISDCDGLLTLTDVKLSENPFPETFNDYDSEENIPTHENSELFGQALEEFTLRFSFNDGIISEVCPDVGEKNWVLNFKKGLLSMLHNTMRRFDLDHYGIEDDIHGKCEATYKVLEPNGTSLIIEKSKDLTVCGSRSKLHSMVQSTSYNFRPQIDETKLLKSQSKCTLAIDHYIYKGITCLETHIFQPFSNNDAGATTVIKQSLILQNEQEKELDEQSLIERRSRLSYDVVPTPKPISDELKISRDLIKKLCQLSSNDVQIEFSDLFTKFIHTARYLSYSALSVLHRRAGSICPSGKKHVLDALPFLGTSAAVGVMRDLNGVPETTINEWMMSIALIPRPDIKMLEYLHQLLEKNEAVSISLAVSSLTYTFCNQNPACVYENVVDNIIDLLEKRVLQAYSSKNYDRKTKETMVVSLKSLSNIGIIRDSFQPKLMEIIKDHDIDVSIRIISVEAFRRSNCEESRSYFEDLFRNQKEDVEVRIAAYLQVMRCPNYVVISTIRHSLEIEEVNQVGSFIWSHLHNLLKSSIPSRVEIQGLLSDKELVKKFNSDVRKFSSHYEGSVFLDEYNTGANYESNVIFSPSSYIPRSASLNLTVDLFGESINLLEIYGRFEGFEKYLESMFGPKGAFSKKKLQEKFSKMRWGRDVKDSNATQSEIDKYSDVIDNNFDDPKINLGLKIFGNDLKYTTFNGDQEVMAAFSKLNPINHLKRVFSGTEITYNKAVMFMDTTYIVPSGAGFPLTLNAVGTASINTKIWGKLNSTNFMKDRSLDLNANIQPNIGLDVIGTMSVDSYFASTGIKLKTSLYTSSALKTSIAIRGTKLIKVSFGLPKQTTEILGAKSELIVMKGSLEQVQAGLVKNKVAHSICTWPALDKAIGIKLCTDYHFINVTSLKNAPSFLLAGPSRFRFGLEKVDPLARTYFMEYQWNVKNDQNYISFILDTPGAHISRLLTLNITHNNETGNLTLQIFSTNGNILAHGKYKNTNLEKYINVGLDIDKQRKFSTLLSLKKQPLDFGYNYTTNLHITVNNDTIAEIQGYVKWVEKFGVSQSDVNLEFNTKRLSSKLFGYISRTENSIGTNLKLDYKFIDTRTETVRLDFSLSDKSKRIIAKYVGTAQIQTTAYPNMNFNTTVQFQKASGYTEFDAIFQCGPTLFAKINKDDNAVTTFKAFVAHRTFVNATKLKIETSLTKPIAGWDLKGIIVYERVGHWFDTKILARYNTGKEILIQAFWSNPKQVLDDIEARLNITAPSYKPMILKVKIKEQNFRNYAIDIDGTWFTGFNITIKGVYNYRSIITMSQHHLKMMLKSPSFNEINADFQYYRDNKELKIDLKADHSIDNYEFYIKHVAESNLDMITVGKIRYKMKVYSFISDISLKEEKRIKLELHIDQWRDIHFAMWGHNMPLHKAVGFEIKWDANRDPNQKLVVTGDISNPATYNHNANFVISYPGRTINGIYKFLWIDEKYSTIAHLTWSNDHAFTAKLDIRYRDTDETYFFLKSELLTPFDDIRKTSLNAGYHHVENMYKINGSVHWQDNQHVAVDLFEDYEVLATAFKGKAHAIVSSTVKDIPSISAELKHQHNISQVDSNLYITYHPKQIIDVGSSWKIDLDEKMTNLTGTVTILTPFRGLNKGLLVSKIYVTKSRHIRGVADLDVDHRKFRATVQGSLQKITRSMLKFDITTPFEKYNKITGKFGIMEEQRYVACMLTYPSGSTGIEIKLLVHNFTNFDVIFNVATPIEFLQNILAVGKIQEEEADFRLGWNTLLVGFTGIWHYVDIKDFEYSYKVYTPIEGFKENGVVAKLLFKEGLDSEISIKLAEKRLGLIIKGNPKPMILKELGIKTQTIYKEKLTNANGSKQVAILEEEDPFSWEGYVEIDTLLYQTMEGTIDIDQKGTVYDVLASLILPKGKAELRNEFDYISNYKMKNRLYLNLPFNNFKTVTSDYELDITPDKKYYLALDFNYQNDTNWIEAGSNVHYILPQENEKDYRLTYHLHTPSSAFPQVDLSGALTLDMPTYGIDLNITTLKCDTSFKGMIMSLDNILKTEIQMYMLSYLINIPHIKVKFYKELKEFDSIIKFYFNMPRTLTKLNCTALWTYNSIKDFEASMDVNTSIKNLGRCNGSIEVNALSDEKYAKVNVYLLPFVLNSYGILHHESLITEVFLIRGNIRNNVTLDAKLKEVAPNKRQIQGLLTIDGAVNDIEGYSELANDILTSLQLTIASKENLNVPKAYLDYKLKPESVGHCLVTTLTYGREYINFKVYTILKHLYSWDINIEMETSHKIYNTLQIHGKTQTIGTNTSFTVKSKVPFAVIGDPKFGISLDVLDQHYYTYTYYQISEYSGQCKAIWSWLMLENMSLKLLGSYQNNNSSNDREAAINVFYINPGKTFEALKMGGNVDLGKSWNIGGNLSLYLPHRYKMDLEAKAKLSPNNNEVHTILGKLYGHNNYTQIEYLGRYETSLSKGLYGSSGNVSFTNLDNMFGDVDVLLGPTEINNYLEYKTKVDVTNLFYRLRKPNVNTDTVRTYITYKKSSLYHNISCEVFHPGDRSVGKADVDFKEFGNMNGTVNVTTPFKGFEFAGINFVTETSETNVNRFAKVFWVNKTAIFDSKTVITRQSEKQRDSKGIMLLEIPLATRHIARIDYGYSEDPLLSTGKATIEYNKTKILDAKYNCQSESKGDFNKDVIHIEIQNKLLPVGVDYVHGYTDKISQIIDKPLLDTKDIHVYNLYNRTALNVSGEVIVKTTATGQDISLSALHKNRTVKFYTNYDIHDRKLKQYSRLDLAPTIWISYDIELNNQTWNENSEAQEIQINLSYPRRNFTAFGFYNVSEHSLSSEVSLVWDKVRKTVQGALDWKKNKYHPNQQELRLDLKHPSFEKNVTCYVKYESMGKKLADVKFSIDYSQNPNQLVLLTGLIENHSRNNVMNYSYSIEGSHPQTELYLDMKGGVFWRPRYFISHHITEYNRTNFPQPFEALSRIDIEMNEVEFKRKTSSELNYFWGRYKGKYPLYTTNISAISGNDINATGKFYLNFKEKLVLFDLNKTTDGSQSLHMYGIIPDARNVIFNIWRDYEDIRVYDVSYLLRLNHSRLVVANLKWRPDLKQDIKNHIKAFLVNGYNSFTEGATNARQYVRSEVADAVSSIWGDAKPHVHQFLDDVKDLQVIENDFEELKVFLNNSYQANEFYIKDIVGFLLYTFNELPIKSHIESLPSIINEIWDVMGESGKKIQKSIIWVIEKVKQYYTNLTDFINGLLQGDTLEHLSVTFQELLIKYDTFVKDMHVSFIKYVEDLWSKTYQMLVNNWNKTLASIEPTVIKIIHYIEEILWSAGQEFLDFLYMKNSELIDSEYFNKLANFSQDIDKFYKDITGNDTLGAVFKYSRVGWNFFKQKYFEIVPFAKELQQVFSEIVNEITELKNLPTIKFLIQKFDELYDKVKWFYDYFDVQARLHRVISLIRSKLMDAKQNALDAENRYREAKTKFIFEPADGVMYLEQKLPMSWHAFNETPKFDEVSEYKSIKNMQNYFSLSKLTLMNLYLEYKSILEPSEWLPPFSARAMIIGGHHYITFDRKIYNFHGQCTYLLATDFKDKNFSISVSYNKENIDSYKILILIEKILIEIDMKSKGVRINNSKETALPIQIHHAYIYQEADIISLESEYGFSLECNMKFDICIFEVTGWYFGKTAGLWGTMNHEPSDDFLTSRKEQISDINVFANSWTLDNECSGRFSLVMPRKQPTDDIKMRCDSFFLNKVSPFVTCFPKVPVYPFLEICLQSTSEEEVCSSAIAYMNLCEYEAIPLRIPDTCIRCKLLNGTEVPEGEFKVFRDEDVPTSADIVFIIEASSCNENVRRLKKIDSMIENIEKELVASNIKDNRYSLLAFGDDEIFSEPRSIVMDSKIFTGHKSIPTFFDHIKYENNQTSDVFEAIVSASKLLYRSGVSKIFILLPCTNCRESRMQLDYSILHQLLLENDISLHIIMDEEFQLKKPRSNKIFFGIDRILAYTKKDFENFKGDNKLRKEVQLPKNNLGYCLPLAIESSGSIFSGRILETKMANRAALVFAKRVAKSAQPKECKTCECTGFNTGISYMECYPCSYPTPLTYSSMNEDELLSIMQPGDNLDYDEYL